MKTKQIFIGLFTLLLFIGCSENYYGNFGNNNNNSQEPKNNTCVTPEMEEELWNELNNGLVESPASDVINCPIDDEIRYEYILDITYTEGGTGNTRERYIKVLQKRCEFSQVYNTDLNDSCLDFIVPPTIAIYYDADLDVYMEVWAGINDDIIDNSGVNPERITGRRSKRISVNDDEL